MERFGAYFVICLMLYSIHIYSYIDIEPRLCGKSTTDTNTAYSALVPRSDNNNHHRAVCPGAQLMKHMGPG